jgi:hypothetical protein
MEKINRAELLIELDNELLQGGVILSEWCVFIVKSADIAFINEANLATIITAMAGIESFLRTEDHKSKGKNLYRLIEDYDLVDSKAKNELHRLRRYRNGWVHLENEDDEDILINEEKYIKEVEDMAVLAITLLRTVVYSNQWV